MSQTLEKRQLLAGDLAWAHNYVNSLDVDNNFELTPKDALMVINFLNRNGSGTEITEFDESRGLVDVNADGRVTAIDALQVVNGLERGEEIGESLELVISARDMDDNEILPDANGDINVDVGQVFELELGFKDLRVPIFNREGVARYIADIAVQLNGMATDALVPVVTETQRLFFDRALIEPSFLNNPDNLDGTISFSLGGSGPPVDLTVEEFILSANGPAAETEAVLQQLGYGPDEVSVEFLDFNGPEILFEIRYLGERLYFDDLPPLQAVVTGTDDPVGSSTDQFDPVNADGTINGNALPFNLDFQSRAEMDPYFENLPTGSYSEMGGFNNIGGTNLANPPENADLTQVFDAVKIPVVIRQPVTDLRVELNPANDESPDDQDVEGIVLWALDIIELPLDEILINVGDASNGFQGPAALWINAIGDAINTPPVVSGPVVDLFNEDEAGTFNVDLLSTASDADNDPLNLVGAPTLISGNAVGIDSSSTANTLVVTPTAYNFLAEGATEVVVYEYTIGDGNGGQIGVTATITIEGRNDAPTADDTSVTTSEGVAVDIDVASLIDDVDGDPLTLAVGTQGTKGTAQLIAGTTTFTYTPTITVPAGAAEQDTFTYLVDDGIAGPVTATVTITITEVNEAPLAGDDVIPAPFNEDQAGTFDVDLLTGASDPDGDTLNVEGDPTVVSGDATGISFDAANNALVVTPTAYNSLAQGESAVVSYEYTITDGRGGTATKSATITVDGRNDAPTAAGTSVTTSESVAVDIDVASLIADVDGDALTVALGTQGTNGTAQLVAGTTTFTYTPTVTVPTGGSEQDTFTYTVSDGIAAPVTATITVTITEVNEPPVAGADVVPAPFNEDQAGTFNVDLLTGASDPDGDTLSVQGTPTVVSGDASGISFDAASNTLVVTPTTYNSLAQGESAVVSYEYAITDGRGGTATKSATVTIEGRNDAPTAAGTTVTTSEGVAVNIDVAALINDVDGDALTVALGTQGSKGTAQLVPGSTTFTYTPTISVPSGSEQDTFTYTVDDGIAGPVTATITVTITEVNDPPVAGADVIPAPFNEDQAGTFNVDLLTGASDPDGDTLSVQGTPTLVSGDAAGISFNAASNSLVVTPTTYNSLADGESAVVSYEYTITDGRGGTATKSATITIEGRNDAPSTVDLTASTSVGQPVVIDVLTSSSDPDASDVLTIASVSDTNAVIFVDSADGRQKIRYTPPANFTGDVDFDYTVSDGLADSTATVTVSVTDFVGAEVSGSIFFDHVENIIAHVNGAPAIRNGVKDADESGLGGVPVRLVSAANENSTGQAIELVTFTTLHGDYEFTGVAPGTYRVIYDISSRVVYAGNSDGSSQPGVMSIDVADGTSGPDNKSGLNFTLADTRGSALGNIDLLVSSHLKSDPDISQTSNGGRQGGLVSLYSDGEQEFFKALRGYPGIKAAELVLNDAQDSALLTVLEESGVVRTTQLFADDFVVSSDGTAVQFFGGMEDFLFTTSPSQALTDEFDDYRKAIDEAISAFGTN